MSGTDRGARQTTRVESAFRIFAQTVSSFHNSVDAVSRELFNLLFNFLHSLQGANHREQNDISSLSSAKISFDSLNRENLASCLRIVCRQFDLPADNVEEAARLLRGEIIKLPDVAEVTWAKRSGVDKELNPIQFRDKYWKKYIDAGLMYQIDLKTLDKSLFEAIKIHCRNRQIPPTDQLPPANVARAKRCEKIVIPERLDKMNTTMSEKAHVAASTTE
jgi:hypothetical protein